MSGMDNASGLGLDDLPHIRQSVRDILTTPIGSRVMRREYGSLVPQLIDHPVNGGNRLRLAAASYMAIRKWEPRIVLTRVGFELGADGAAMIDIEAVRADGPRTGQSLSFTAQVTG